MVEKKQDRNVIQWTSQLAIRWTSPLSGQSGRGLKGPRYFQVDDMRYELGMTLNLYGALLRERALEVVCTGMSAWPPLTDLMFTEACSLSGNVGH